MPIEQLLERYFNADTTLSEERQLRDFFASDNVPAHLEQYRAMFAAIKQTSETKTAAYRPQVVQAHRITFVERVAPLFRVAACIAIIVSVLMAAQQGMKVTPGIDILQPTNTQSVGAEVSELGATPIVEPDTIAVVMQQH